MGHGRDTQSHPNVLPLSGCLVEFNSSAPKMIFVLKRRNNRKRKDELMNKDFAALAKMHAGAYKEQLLLPSYTITVIIIFSVIYRHRRIHRHRHPSFC